MIEALVISNILSWLAVIGLAIAVYAMVRQIGILHERMGPTGALTLAKGMKTGERLPVQTYPSLTGSPLTLGGASGSGRSTLIFFASPDCPVCKSLLPVLQSIRDSEADWLDVVLASDGPPEPHHSFIEERQLGAYPYILSSELGLRLGVSKLPYAALIGPDGVLVAHGLTNSREHIESLFEAAREGVASIQAYLEREQQRADARH